MKKLLPVSLTILVLIGVFGPLSRNSSASRLPVSQNFEPGEVIVKLKPSSSAADALNLIERAKILSRSVRLKNAGTGEPIVSSLAPSTLKPRVKEIVESRGLDRIFLLKLGNGADVAAAVGQLQQRDDVEYAEPNYRVETASFPNDPAFYDQWALLNQGWNVAGDEATTNADIKAYAAWDITLGSPDVLVAVTDTGIDASHPDLQGSIYTNPGEIPDNGIDDDHNGYVDDVHGYNVADHNGDVSDVTGHGTQMSGIIGAGWDNMIGISGVSRSKILPVKFFRRTGPSPDDIEATVADAASAILYSIAMGASIINASWRTLLRPDQVTPAESQALKEAVEAANDAGALLVCAAGNDGFNLDYSKVYPGAYQLPNEIIVAASDYNDFIWHSFIPSISDGGFGPHSVHIAAPGVSILTTRAHGNCADCSDSADPRDWYNRVTGTSPSTAYVSGVASLVKSLHPTETAALIKKRILDGAQKIDSLQQLVIDGARLDANGALIAEIHLVPPVFASFKYKKGSGKLVVNGSNIQLGMQVIVGTKSFEAKPAADDLSSFKLNVPKSEFPVGVAVPIKLRNPDGGESGTLTYTR